MPINNPVGCGFQKCSEIFVKNTLRLLFLLAILVPFSAFAADALPTPVALPSKVYGLAGEDCRVRFDTLVYAPVKESILFDVESGPGAQSNGALVWFPSEKSPGGPFKIGIYSGGNFRKLAEASSEFVFGNPKAVTQAGKVRWLPIGDSLTGPGFYVAQTIEKLGKALPLVTLLPVGSVKMAPDSKYPGLHHEGRGGWHWQRFLEGYNIRLSDTGRVVSSPFVFGPRGRDDFDFARYLREKLGGETPEIITILLGANDVFGASPAITPEKVEEIMERARAMVGKIQTAVPDSVIGILTMLPPSDQTAFGANYQNGTAQWQYRRASQLYNEALVKNFDGRQGERIYVVPITLAFDAATAYPKDPPNALHPNEQGFAPVSLELAAWMTHLLETKAVTTK